MNDHKCFKCGKFGYCHSIGEGIGIFDAPYLCMNCKEDWAKYYKQSANNVDDVTNSIWKYWFETFTGKKVKHYEPLRRFIFR